MSPIALSAGPILLSAGIVVGLVVSTVVYADAVRRDRSQSGDSPRSPKSPQSVYLLWPVSVGLASLAGFLVPYSFDDALHHAYFAWLKPSAVVTSPYEMLALHLAVGTAISVAAVFAYGLGSRYGPLVSG